MRMEQNLHQYTTTFQGAIVDVWLDLDRPFYVDRLDSVWYEGVDVTALLTKETLSALSMEAESAYSGDDAEDPFDPARDAFRIGD